METHADQNHHPIGIYLKVWLLLFVLSTLSYAVDYLEFQGITRWSLIIIFMLLKAGFIIAVFMHLMWERMALIATILAPPIALLFLVGFMVSEGLNVFDARVEYFGQPESATRIHVSDVLGVKH
ncbi:cytochrome C oxidase subunit IV family protein [Litorivicinus sp.]|nr:cytochrome C oxidase subunit IV family protein [Litorivicinus sp.]MDB9862535.1 cytochrome C oxidase subunit IV family protein [Litorivicinus sp.]MDC1207774.1 cytochrome C oxidase subunit IV family protein [Litorivicinus sp.]MDC1240784.1 cytochrome C oxidase subunit IV family protein [Litorivicinus sp.]MDC1467030.1 cytochrome C oxidase subunit IV family protein [Litorivicinus sp.]